MKRAGLPRRGHHVAAGVRRTRSFPTAMPPVGGRGARRRDRRGAPGAVHAAYHAGHAAQAQLPAAGAAAGQSRTGRHAAKSGRRHHVRPTVVPDLVRSLAASLRRRGAPLRLLSMLASALSRLCHCRHRVAQV